MVEFQLSDCRVDLERLIAALILFAVLLFPLSRVARKIRKIDGSMASGPNGENGVGRRSDVVIVAAFLVSFAALMAMDSWYSFWDLMNCLEDGTMAESFRPDTISVLVVGGLAGAAVWFGLRSRASGDRKDESKSE